VFEVQAKLRVEDLRIRAKFREGEADKPAVDLAGGGFVAG
jgi:hypothetical protein